MLGGDVPENEKDRRARAVEEELREALRACQELLARTEELLRKCQLDDVPVNPK